jgi:hypothetical protein
MAMDGSIGNGTVAQLVFSFFFFFALVGGWWVLG